MSTAAPRALDVRPLPPGRKFSTVRAVFRDLDAGESFVLVDDRDPAPMHARIDDEQPGELRWEILDTGPPVWAVRVGRRAPPNEGPASR